MDIKLTKPDHFHVKAISVIVYKLIELAKGNIKLHASRYTRELFNFDWAPEG